MASIVGLFLQTCPHLLTGNRKLEERMIQEERFTHVLKWHALKYQCCSVWVLLGYVPVP